jgi:phosphate transport system substrate-binding protein
MKKRMLCLSAAILIAVLLSACGMTSLDRAENFDSSVPVTVISREDGSGTRSAFVSLFGIQRENRDETTLEAVTINSTSVMKMTVAGDFYAIGYISFAALDRSVKALEIDGVPATSENIGNGSYMAARPFNIATAGELSVATRDFIGYILSREGQEIVSENGYIPLSGRPAYDGTQPMGKIVVAGSSSVTPIMEKLKEAYLDFNTNVEIEIQQSDSSTGMNAALQGICDIGMASRELKDSELAAGLTSTVIATDGIAVIVSPQNPVNGLCGEQIHAIFTGEAQTWGDAA